MAGNSGHHGIVIADPSPELVSASTGSGFAAWVGAVVALGGVVGGIVAGGSAAVVGAPRLRTAVSVWIVM